MPAKKSLLLPLNNFDLTEADIFNLKREVQLGFLKPGDKRLNDTSSEVNFSKDSKSEIKKYVERLEAAASGQRLGRKKKKGARLIVGAAAPQIGIMKRIIFVDTKVDSEKRKVGKLLCFINPEIIWRSQETAEGREGCFSVGIIRGLVRRPIALKMKAYTIDGRPIEKVFEGYTARIIQHEIDHLNGIRFPDRIKSPRKLHWVHDEELAVYPKKINTWKRYCSFELWSEVKKGKHYI